MKENLKMEVSVLDPEKHEEKVELGHVASFFVELGIEWLIDLADYATKDCEETTLSQIFQILSGPTIGKLNELLEAVSEIKQDLVKIDEELNHLDSLITEMCNKIIDILNDTVVKNEFSKIQAILYESNNDYSGAWTDYTELTKYIDSLQGEPTPEIQREIQQRVDSIISRLNLNSNSGAELFYKDIKKLANIVSDCFDADLGHGVSEKPNESGDHFINHQTYVKAVLKKLKDSYPFEHQVYSGVLNELNRIVHLQLQLLTLYNETTNYLLSNNSQENAIAKTMQNNYSKVYNLTVNSINNALEQSHVADLMTPFDLKCSLYLSDNKNSSSEKKEFYRVRMVSEEYDGAIYYISKKPVKNLFVQYSDSPYSVSYNTFYDWNFPKNKLNMRHLYNKDSLLASLPQFTGNKDSPCSQLTLFSSTLYVKERGICDYLINVGSVKIDQENFEYIMHDAPGYMGDPELPPLSSIKRKAYNYGETCLWYEFYWSKIKNGAMEASLCKSMDLVTKSTICFLPMKGIEKRSESGINYGYTVKVSLNIKENKALGTVNIPNQYPLVNESDHKIYTDLAPKAKFKIIINLQPGSFVKSIKQSKFECDKNDFAYYEPIEILSTDINRIDTNKERQVELEFYNYFDSTEFDIYLDGYFIEVSTDYKSQNRGSVNSILLGNYILHNSTLKSKGFQRLNGSVWQDIIIITGTDFSTVVGNGTYRSFAIDQNDKVFYGNTVKIHQVSPV